MEFLKNEISAIYDQYNLNTHAYSIYDHA